LPPYSDNTRIDGYGLARWFIYFKLRVYNEVVKVITQRIMVAIVIVIVVFLLAVATVFILIRMQEGGDMPAWFVPLFSGGIFALISLPVLLWFAIRPPYLHRYSAFALEELTLNEEELTNAVRNWVFTKHRRIMEASPDFLENEDGEVTCRLTIRKE